MKKISEISFLAALGGSIYYGLEILYRGFSHWSMFILGGLCMIFIGKQGQWSNWKSPIWLQLLRSIIFVSCGEFITGIIVNKWLGWDVWDYSDRQWNLFGQICLLFAGIFTVLSFLGILISKWILIKIYRE
ncbi:MAG: hypothetical protein R3Y40_06555 [Eubacteriales bacterium]